MLDSLVTSYADSIFYEDLYLYMTLFIVSLAFSFKGRLHHRYNTGVLSCCCCCFSLSHVRLFTTPWTAARQASLSITNSWSLLKLMYIASVMPSNHLILCRPLLLPPSIFPSIRVFFKEPVLCIRWPKYWSFIICPSSEYSGLISFRMD